MVLEPLPASDAVQIQRRGLSDAQLCSLLGHDDFGAYGRGVLAKAQEFARPDGYIVIADRTERDLVADVTALIERVPGWTLIHHEPRWEKNCGLDFPPESEIFGPKYDCSTACWVLKRPQETLTR